MGEYFESDDAYRAAIRALATGKIDPGGELGRLQAEALQRLQEAGLPWVFDRCADVFVEYHEKVRMEPARINKEDKIRKAMLTLAEELRKSGLSREFQIEDAAVWDRIVADQEHEKRVKMFRDFHPNCGYMTPLEVYLRAAVEQITESNEIFGPAFDEYLGEVMPPNKSSRNIDRFVFRRISNQVEFIAGHLQRLERDENAPAVPPEFYPRAGADLDPDDPRTPYGHNQVAARIASLLLAKPVTNNDIKKSRGDGGSNIK